MPDSSFTYLHLFPHPSPIAHKVWILDCRTCDSFLTNRAMKAVLLLRPNVSLYSSDALPANCSAYSASPEILRPPASHKPSTRTCECLTQSLCCHTCGTTIGYMIVVPCTRCTSSISATNRATNGHRFVFHSSEVSGTERHYIQDEPGVIPFDPLVFLPPPPFSPSPYYSHHPPRAASPPVARSDYLPTPPLEFANPVYNSPTTADLDASSRARLYSPPSHSPPPVIPVQSHYYPRSSSPPLPVSPSFYPADQKESPFLPPTLKPGNVIFWHHLARNGEIPGVTDDHRARSPVKQVFYDR